LAKGKSEYIDVTIVPKTTAQENRYLVWESENPEIATVKNGYITGVSAGTTKVTVKSKHKPEIFKEITVTVTNEYGAGVYFSHDNYNVIYVVNTTEFDLKTITVLNLEDVTISNVWYELNNIPETGSVDTSALSEGIIKFNKEKVIIIVSVHAFDSEGVEYSDKIKIWYVQV
jgi:GH43 family beta-xylosidase